MSLSSMRLSRKLSQKLHFGILLTRLMSVRWLVFSEEKCIEFPLNVFVGISNKFVVQETHQSVTFRSGFKATGSEYKQGSK
jgi:hypothetical protein